VRHALRSALVPISQLAILELGGLIGGAVVTEKLFRWPGLGDLTVAAIQNRDVELVVGLTLVGAFVVTITLLLADVLALLLDPRASARGTP
jgi:peptide/nickel transport system permease protein